MKGRKQYVRELEDLGHREREENFATLRAQLDFVPFKDHSPSCMSKLLYFYQVCCCVLQCVAVLLQYCLKNILLLSELLNDEIWRFLFQESNLGPRFCE